MKRIADSNELAGMVGIGMKREALRWCRQKLKNESISGEDFRSAVDAILTQADGLKTWSKLIDTAYARLSKRDQRLARFNMLAFHFSNEDHKRAGHFIPSRFDGPNGNAELAFAMATLLELGKTAAVKRLAKRLPGAIEGAEDPIREMLMDCQAEYFARRGDWNNAVQIWETMQRNEHFSERGALGVAEIHTACALIAIRRGLQLAEEFRNRLDAQLETTLPGNESVRWAQTEKRLRGFKQKLELLLPDTRRRELGIDGSNTVDQESTR